MTVPTITWGHGFMTDCDDLTGYIEAVGGMAGAQASLTVLLNDIFQVEGTCDDAGDEYCYYHYPDEGGADNLSLSTNTYTRYAIRWKTSASSNGLGATATAVFNDASTQQLVGATNPEFSTTWTVSSGTLTSSKTLDHIRLGADDYPNSIAAGTFQVYYDFVLIFKDLFTFPTVQPGGVWFKPRQKIVQTEIPGRDGDVLERLGMKSPEIVVQGKVLSGESWGSPDLEYLYYIVRDTDLWQWFTSDPVDCKVMLKDFDLGQVSESGFQADYELQFLMYSLSNLAEATWQSKQWFGK